MQVTISPDVTGRLAFSVDEACKITSLKRSTFYKHLKSGKIPARKLGNRTIVLWDELEKALKSLPFAGSAS
jgi:excisionase family DNA binding protein